MISPRSHLTARWPLPVDTLRNWSCPGRRGLPEGSDLDRTEAFYARAGFADAGRYDDYLLPHNDGVELHSDRHDTVTPSMCFLHVTDAMKLWKQLRDQGVEGVGDIADQDYGLREFVLTDPDGNRVRIGSPRP